MYANELQRRLEKAGYQNTISVAAHPGVAMTELARHMPKLLVMLIGGTIGPFVTHSVKNGAQPTLLAALGNDVKGGEYFGPTGYNEMKGKPGKARSTQRSRNEDLTRRLWEVSEELTGIKYL